MINCSYFLHQPIVFFASTDSYCSTPAPAINIVCPHYQDFQGIGKEQHLIYNVKESFIHHINLAQHSHRNGYHHGGHHKKASKFPIKDPLHD